MNTTTRHTLVAFIIALLLAPLAAPFITPTALAAQDSLPPLKDGKAPTNLDELWGDYNPRKEPLETQVVREWTESVGGGRALSQCGGQK